MADLNAINESVARNKRNMNRTVSSTLTSSIGISKMIDVAGVGTRLFCKAIIISFSLLCKVLSKKISRGMIIMAKVIQMILIRFEVLYLSNLMTCPNLLFDCLFISRCLYSSSSSERAMMFSKVVSFSSPLPFSEAICTFFLLTL